MDGVFLRDGTYNGKEHSGRVVLCKGFARKWQQSRRGMCRE